MQRNRVGGVGMSVKKSTKTLPKTLNKDGYMQARSSQNEVTHYQQRPKGNPALSTKLRPTPEDTIAKYRHMAVKSFTINPDDYSHTCVLYARRLKEKLWKTTGTEEIRINDPQYTERICRILHQRRKEQLDQQDRDRAEQEISRMRRLMERGIITADQLKSDFQRRI